MHDNEQYLFEALRAGASGYVLKSVADRDLVEACRATMRGEPFLYPGAVRALMRDFVERARRGETPPDDPLTPREVEIVKLIAEARTTREIAGDARAEREDGRAPPHEHPRQARDARPRRARPLRDPARTGRAVGESHPADGGHPGWRSDARAAQHRRAMDLVHRRRPSRRTRRTAWADRRRARDLVVAATAATAREGFEAIAARARPQVALVDLHLPDDDGLSLCLRTRSAAGAAARRHLLGVRRRRPGRPGRDRGRRRRAAEDRLAARADRRPARASCARRWTRAPCGPSASVAGAARPGDPRHAGPRSRPRRRSRRRSGSSPSSPALAAPRCWPSSAGAARRRRMTCARLAGSGGNSPSARPRGGDCPT